MVARAQAAAATRERILAAAWERFAGRAYEDVRLADVAQAAGVTAQTLHSRFGTKDALFVEAWRWRWAPEGPRRYGAAPGDVAGAVRVLYDSYEEGGDAALRLIAQEDRIPAVHDMADEGRAWHREWVERTFAPLLEGARGAVRERRIAKLIVATDLLVWKLLRREMGLDRRAAERLVVEMVTAARGRH
ncbi:MAG TPA: helix-turn-helix domain-containing protein [Solirubrobacteraceae bacterium]|jgi:AcrR family transcriptional regulator